MLDKLFLKHPASVGETYDQHCLHALRFSSLMFLGAVVCAIHAFLPCLFERTGSRIIQRLHTLMVESRQTLSCDKRKNKPFAQ